MAADGSLTYTGNAVFTDISVFLAPASEDPQITITERTRELTFALSSTVTPGPSVTVALTGSRLAVSSPSAQFKATVTLIATNIDLTRYAVVDLATNGADDQQSSSSSSSGSQSLAASASSTDTSSTSTSANSGSLPSSTATQAPATTSGATSNNSTTDNGIGAGAIAGIVVGILAVLALVAAFFFIRRRKQKKIRTNQYNSKTATYNNSTPEGEAYVLATGTKANWQKNLPQPESDQTITQLANRTLDAIELFVENYYSDQPTRQLHGTVPSDMAVFKSSHLPHPLASVISSSRSPTVLIKHCLAYYMLQKIDPTRNNAQSLLPSEYVIPAKGDQQALSQLRTRIAQKSNIDQDEHYLTLRNQVSEASIQQIEQAFQPWARGDPQDRIKSLRGILTHLSEMGNKFFSQAANFEWRWDATRKLLPHQLVMLPGLDKTTDSEAVPLARPIRLVEPRLGKYGE